ncbi:BTAD domain-containing putative transcriptional regulator [Dactylosporangium sp. CS-033363]|uniref:BTAD domain-containing putative transcriptional regulator n=1 Tax=Dactylosporangium sp. CS-033363 TaxID=3239935 RepID=UPI003D8D2FEF
MQIGILGPFEVRTDGGTLADVPGARLRGLLVALALRPGQVVPKATLIDWIWGEQPPADAANALQRLVSRLRKVLPDGSVEGHTDGYRLTVAPDAVDAVRFERLAAPGPQQDLPAALALWRGAAMQDVGLQESAAYDAAVTRLEGLRLSTLEDRFDAETDGAAFVTELTDLVAANPIRERLAAALMRALVAAGRDSEALLVFQRTREALADALGVDPSAELTALHAAMLRGEVGRREETRKSNLRSELSSFVGRAADVAAVRELVAANRLTTLIGPGGAGKTRLATETARTLLGDLPDGAWLVELADIGADGDVARSTMTVLGLRDALLGQSQSADVTDRLIAAVRDRAALLVLDNCEHVIESAAAFAHRVLGECRRLRILATSREPLGITGEVLYPVEPLALPGGDADPGEIESSAAVRLLRDRAGAVRRQLTVDAATLATMARVCRALDGMPLAIELAAARLRTLSIEQLAQRLDDRFRLLTSGSRTALPRHRTLRAVVDWSWELLTDAERAVLRRLAVFTGGASLEAAERVCAGDDVAPDQVLELLTSLAEKSLLLTEDEGAPRYRMIGTIQEYAGQRLAEAGESDSARRSHLAYFTELAETAEPHLRRAEQLTWLAILDAEQENLGTAMRGALAAGEAQAAMRLAVGAGWYWWLAGRKAEGQELIGAAAALPGEADDDTRANVYAIMSMFVTSGRSDEQDAAEWIRQAYQYSRDSRHRHPLMGFVVPLHRMLESPEASIAEFEALLGDEDPFVRALARLHQGKMRIVIGRGGPEADAYLEQALAEFRAIGERFGISFALTELADRIATRGEIAAACAHYEEAIAAVAEVGDIEDVIRLRARQARLYWLHGDEAASTAALADAQRWTERVTWPDALAELALCRADLARWAGRPDESRRHLEQVTALLGADAERPTNRAGTEDLLGWLAEDLEESREHRAAAWGEANKAGHAPLVAAVLVGIADLALRRGQDEQAARLLAAGAGVRGLQDAAHPDVVRIERTARERLGDQRYAEAAREGAQSSWDELVAVTLAV